MLACARMCTWLVSFRLVWFPHHLNAEAMASCFCQDYTRESLDGCRVGIETVVCIVSGVSGVSGVVEEEKER